VVLAEGIILPSAFFYLYFQKKYVNCIIITEINLDNADVYIPLPANYNEITGTKDVIRGKKFSVEELKTHIS